MKKQFNNWYLTILILSIISIFFPILFPIITAIAIGYKYKTFKDAFNDLENIQDVNRYCNLKNAQINDSIMDYSQ